MDLRRSEESGSRLPVVLFVLSWLGLLAYLVDAPPWADQLNPSVGLVDWVTRFAGLVFVLLVIFVPLLVVGVLADARRPSEPTEQDRPDRSRL